MDLTVYSTTKARPIPLDGALTVMTDDWIDAGNSCGHTVSDLLKCCRVLRDHEKERDQLISDLAMTVRRLAYRLNKAVPDNKIVGPINDFLRRKGLQGSILREETPKGGGA